MGRPLKEGLDYYPVNVDIDENDKIMLLQSEHKIAGEVVLQRLWRAIYRGKGYYYQFGEDECLLLSKKIGEINPVKINEIVETCLKRRIFDYNLYKKYGILTSKRIQSIYLLATTERKEVYFDARFLLIKLPKRANIRIVNASFPAGNRGNNPVSPTITGGETGLFGGETDAKPDTSADLYTKESKVNKTEVNEKEGGAPLLFSKDYFKISLAERKEKFLGGVGAYRAQFGDQICDKFFRKWSETTPDKRRMAFEMERTWDLDYRILEYYDNWKINEARKPEPSAPRKGKVEHNLDVGVEVAADIINEIRGQK